MPRVTALAALTGPLPKLGVVVVAALAAAALLLRGPRTHSLAMLGALALAPALLLVDIWNSPQLRVVHRHPLLTIVAALGALAVLAVVAGLISRRPALLAPLVVLALPFRIPIQAGDTTANLLVPLYMVVAAGSLAFIAPALLPGSGRRAARAWSRAGPAATGGGFDRFPAVGWIERLLALYVVVYGLQALYSNDFEKALQQMVFFYVPFALAFCLLRRLDWTPRLVQTCLKLVVGLAVLFAVVGFVEYATKTILLNPKLIAANAIHTYFTVNSVFFDPNIFGRFLALVMILLGAVLLYGRRQRLALEVIAVLAVLWAGLVLTLSRSSLGALLVGLGMLAALRWRVSRALVTAAAVVGLGAAAIAASPTTFGLNQGLNGASSGRPNLVTGGLGLFADRPLWGYGSGSFESEYRAHHARASQNLSASHTIPITIAAEQGLIGEVAYVALVVAALITLVRGARADAARAAIAAAFLALVFHTLLYADFLEDPLTWALAGIGVALASKRPSERDEVEPRPEELSALAA